MPNASRERSRRASSVGGRMRTGDGRSGRDKLRNRPNGTRCCSACCTRGRSGPRSCRRRSGDSRDSRHDGRGLGSDRSARGFLHGNCVSSTLCSALYGLQENDPAFDAARLHELVLRRQTPHHGTKGDLEYLRMTCASCKARIITAHPPGMPDVSLNTSNPGNTLRALTINSRMFISKCRALGMTSPSTKWIAAHTIRERTFLGGARVRGPCSS